MTEFVQNSADITRCEVVFTSEPRRMPAMRLLLSLPFNWSLVLLLGAFLPQAVIAQTEQTNEYIYIGMEAEDHTLKHERWVTTTPSTPTVETDPDGNHSDQASGSTYLELLPDVRVTHEDTFGPPTAYWGRGGQGPNVDYKVDFPEPGRYYVHVRAYSTGTEDNGIHVGIDGIWPESGQRMQFCSASRRAWWWGSSQRDAGGNGSCGVEKTIWLDVGSAGMHTVSFSAREDGFEFDRFALIKDLSNNTRICSPLNITDVSCRDGSIESADGFVDLRVRLSAEAVGTDPDVEPPNPIEIGEGGDITLSAKIENLDGFDTATDIVLTLLPVAGDWQTMTMDSRCSEEGDTFKCYLDQLHPTAPDENELFVFTMRAIKDGNLRIDAAVFGAEADDSPNNDVGATIVNVLPADSSDLMLVMSADGLDYETGEPVLLSVALSNVSQIAANNVRFNLSVPSTLAVKTELLPDACSSGTQIECLFDTVNAAGNEAINIEMTVLAAGTHTLSGQLQASNDENEANNSLSVSVSSTLADIGSTTEGSADADAGGNTGPGSSNTGDATSVGQDASAGTIGSLSAGTTAGETGGSTDASIAGTTGGVAGGATAGTADGGASNGEVDASTGVTASSNQQLMDDDSGAMTHWFVFLLALLCSARLYGWHKRQSICV